LNGMTHNLMDLQVGGTSLFRVGRLGNVNVGSSLTTGSFISSGSQIATTYASQASVPALTTTGAWFTGGTSTTTKPHVLIEASGATSNNWSTLGTGLGVNAPSGFGGHLINLQVNGVNAFRVFANGSTVSAGSVTCAGNVFAFAFDGSSRITSFADNTITLLNSGSTDFARLQFGGITSSFPALQTASSNTQTALTATFTNGSANIITAANTFAANDVVQFTGTVPSGFATGTNYFVIATGLTTTNIQVSATSGGAAITAASAGTAPWTVVRQTSATITNGSSTWTSTFAHGLRVGDIVVLSGGTPSNFTGSSYYVSTVPTTTTFTLAFVYNAAAVVAASNSTGACIFTRSPGIYIRTADNTSMSLLNTGAIQSTGIITSTSIISGQELQYGTKIYNSATGATILGPNQLRQVFTNIGQNNFSRLSFGTETSSSPALQTATTVAVTVTFTNAVADITTTTQSPVLVAGDVIRFTNSGGALPTSVNSSTDYYIVGTPTATTIQVASSFGGTAIVHNGAGTGTHTATRGNGIYVRNGDNSAYSQLYSGNIVANAPSGFTGNLLDLQLNGASRFSVSSTGVVLASSSIASSGNFVLQSSSNFVGSGNGVMRITNINFNDYERLQFGSTTSASPALQIASSNTQTGLAATFVNGSSTITTATNTYAVNQVVQFTTTGTLPTGFAINTNYFIVGTPTATTIEVSATQGGTAITAGSAGSGTHTVVRQNTCIFTNGSSTVTTASAHTLRVGDVIRFSNSGGSLPSSLSTAQDYYILSTASTTFTFGNFFGGTAITPPETGVTATFSGTPNITTGTQNYVVGSVVRFTTTGTLPTGLATGTDYYVIATSLSTTNIQVSATLGGTAIAYTGTGSGTHTVARQILGNGIQFFTRLPGIYVRTADNTAHADLLTRTISINAPTGFAGNAIDLKVGTSSVFNVSNAGNITTNGSVLSGGNIRAGAANGVGWSGSSSDMVNTFNGGIRMTNSSAADFYQLQFGNGTTSPSFVTFTPVSTTATFTAASATIGASPVLALRAGDVVQFSNSGGALPPEIISGRNYYVLASGLSATTIQVAESLGGTAIVPSTVGTGTHTTSRITGISLRNSPNTALVAQESLYQRFGAGTPEGVVTAPVGATYNRTDGSAGTSFYVKESGTGNTGWVAK